MASFGDNCKSERLPASTAGLSPFHEFTMETSAAMNRKRLSKSSSANPRFPEGIETCRNELVWKHCEISICLSNSWLLLDKSRLRQAQRSRDCNSWMKLSSYSSHKISQRTFSGGNTPDGYSLPCQTIDPVELLCFSTLRYILGFGNNISKTSLRQRPTLVSSFAGTVLSIERNVRQCWFDRARDGSFATRMNQASRTRSQDSIYLPAVAGCMTKPGSGNI